MIKLINILKEIANSPYTLSSSQKKEQENRSNQVDYNFTTNTNREYYVRFSGRWEGTSKPLDQKHNWAVEMTFFPIEPRTTDDTEVGNENFGRILATVIEALKRYIKEYKPEYVYWKGIKGNKEEKINPGESTKRQKIYNMILDRETKTISGYTQQKGTKISGLIYSGNIPIENSNNIFKYPEDPSFYDEEKSKIKLSKFNLSR